MSKLREIIDREFKWYWRLYRFFFRPKPLKLKNMQEIIKNLKEANE